LCADMVRNKKQILCHSTISCSTRNSGPCVVPNPND
jgi:hypothetical protein